MAGFMKNAMSYLGMADVADDDDFAVDEESATVAEGTFDSDHSVTPMPTAAPAQPQTSSRTTPFPGKMSRITTIHPKTYEDAQMVGRAIRDGVPVVLNLTGVAEPVAYRIVDFSAGVVFGVHGSM
ncbi:MAG: cell division protein SepF, partial [Bifidobacterium merycicum]|nr:cell division protein SepF [Bifidobacterium merycicum]